MKRTNKHLSLSEREKYFAWKESGVSLREIGRRLGRSHATFSREPKRNVKYGQTYVPCLAQRKADKRGEKQRRKAPLKSPLVFLYVRKHLREDGWSPEQIAGRLAIDHPGNFVHFETIYRYIYLGRNKRFNYRQYLTLKRVKRMKKLGRRVHRLGKIPGAISIDLRSKVVSRRRQPGHWETDNMEGKRSDRTSVSVTVERVTRLTKVTKLNSHKSKEKIAAVSKQLNLFPEAIRKTLTADNGAENTNHQKLTGQTNMSVFFCHAYHSWEKGTVENMVGRIRKFVPKGTTVDPITDKEIQQIEDRLNSTPRKCLNFLTPNEKMQQIFLKEERKELTT